jgi:hypothetical protein
VKVDKLKFTKRLKHLLDIALGKVEMQRANIKSVVKRGSEKEGRLKASNQLTAWRLREERLLLEEG